MPDSFLLDIFQIRCSFHILLLLLLLSKDIISLRFIADGILLLLILLVNAAVINLVQVVLAVRLVEVDYILIFVFSFVRTALSRLDLPQPAVALHEETLGVSDHHHGVLVGEYHVLSVVLCVKSNLPPQSLIRWSISDRPVSVR